MHSALDYLFKHNTASPSHGSLPSWLGSTKQAFRDGVELSKPLGWLLELALEAVIFVDVDEAETWAVAAAPLEVVNQTPGEVAPYVRALAEGTDIWKRLAWIQPLLYVYIYICMYY